MGWQRVGHDWATEQQQKCLQRKKSQSGIFSTWSSQMTFYISSLQNRPTLCFHKLKTLLEHNPTLLFTYCFWLFGGLQQQSWAVAIETECPAKLKRLSCGYLPTIKTFCQFSDWGWKSHSCDGLESPKRSGPTHSSTCCPLLSPLPSLLRSHRPLLAGSQNAPSSALTSGPLHTLWVHLDCSAAASLRSLPKGPDHSNKPSFDNLVLPLLFTLIYSPLPSNILFTTI